MSAIASWPSFLSTSFSNFVNTRAAEESSLASSPIASRRRDWNRFIDFTLIEIGRTAALANDDEVRPPTAKSVRSAIAFSAQMAEKGCGLPDRYAPTGDGGIAFEWQFGQKMIRVEFFANGGAETVFFDGPKVVDHQMRA